MFRWEIVESKQLVFVLEKTLDRLGIFGFKCRLEVLDCPFSSATAVRGVDILQQALSEILAALRQLVDHIAGFVNPTPLVCGIRIFLADRSC